jgi:dynein heavy chain
VARYKAIEARINEKPKNEIELQALKDFMEDSKVTIDEMKDEVEEIHARLGSLGRFCTRLSDDDFALAWSTKEWPRLIDKFMVDVEVNLEADKVKMMDALALEKEKFGATLDQVGGTGVGTGYQNQKDYTSTHALCACTMRNVYRIIRTAEHFKTHLLAV